MLKTICIIWLIGWLIAFILCLSDVPKKDLKRFPGWYMATNAFISITSWYLVIYWFYSEIRYLILVYKINKKKNKKRFKH